MLAEFRRNGTRNRTEKETRSNSNFLSYESPETKKERERAFPPIWTLCNPSVHSAGMSLFENTQHEKLGGSGSFTNQTPIKINQRIKAEDASRMSHPFLVGVAANNMAGRHERP